MHHPATFRLRPGCCPVCDLVMPDLLARLRLYATFVTSPFSYLFLSTSSLVTRKTPRLPAHPYGCGWESRQCMQQQQRQGAQGFSCEVLPQFCVLRPNPPTRPIPVLAVLFEYSADSQHAFHACPSFLTVTSHSQMLVRRPRAHHRG